MRHFVLNADQHGKLQAAIEMEGDAKGYELYCLPSVTLKDGKKCTLKDTNLPFLIRLRIRTRNSWLEGNWMNIQPWSTEDPNLYVARLELKDPEGKTVQSRETRIGFRTIEFFPQDGVYLNGTKLVVKGVNRHSFSVDGGRATSAAMSRQDALLVKK